MIKKQIFESDLINGMIFNLKKQASNVELDHLERAAEYLNSAAEIFEDMGMQKNADQILNLLSKIADHHTVGLTPENMVSNIEHHGHPIRLADDGFNDDINDVIEVSDDEKELPDFEDEKD